MDVSTKATSISTVRSFQAVVGIAGYPIATEASRNNFVFESHDKIKPHQSESSKKLAEYPVGKVDYFSSQKKIVDKLLHIQHDLGGCPRIDCPTAVAANWSKNSVLFGK